MFRFAIAGAHGWTTTKTQKSARPVSAHPSKAFGQHERRVRIASKVIESPDAYGFAKLMQETVLRHKDGAKTHIKATFFVDDRRNSVSTIQGYTLASDKPHNG